MSKEHAYAYEAGYRDGSIHYELEHCHACKNVADLQKALDDKAKTFEVGKRWMAKAARLESENAKLRKQVLEMMRFFDDGDYCATCEKAAECDAQEEYDDNCLMRGVFHDSIRELGIEVDNG